MEISAVYMPEFCDALTKFHSEFQRETADEFAMPEQPEVWKSSHVPDFSSDNISVQALPLLPQEIEPDEDGPDSDREADDAEMVVAASPRDFKNTCSSTYHRT